MQIILNTTKLAEIFIECDDFMKGLEAYMSTHTLPSREGQRRNRSRSLSESEMMTIIIYYHYSGFRCFKWYYNLVIRKILGSYFPNAFSYTRFIQLMHECNLYMAFFMSAFRLSLPTDGNYIDSTKLVVCHNRRIKNHRVHKEYAKRGRGSTGWFFGFKLHLIINHLGEIVLFKFSPANVADNNHDLLNSIADQLQGFLFGDKGYISKIAASLKMKGLNLIAKVRDNMKPLKLTPQQEYYMKHRGLIETVFDILKNILDLEHARNRSTKNYFANILGALIAYSFWDNNPCIPTYVHKMTQDEFDNAVFCIS